jgi:MFS family permease
LADRYQSRFIKIKPYIITFQIMMGAIFSILIYGFFVNFWLAAGLYGLSQIICGGISPPLLAIMADSSPKGT